MSDILTTILTVSAVGILAWFSYFRYNDTDFDDLWSLHYFRECEIPCLRQAIIFSRLTRSDEIEGTWSSSLGISSWICSSNSYFICSKLKIRKCVSLLWSWNVACKVKFSSSNRRIPDRVRKKRGSSVVGEATKCWRGKSNLGLRWRFNEWTRYRWNS